MQDHQSQHYRTVKKYNGKVAKISPSRQLKKSGGGQNLERLNVERPIFRKFETSNIEITKVELFDFLFSIQFLIFTSV